jgi:hypothetical protein
MVLAQGYPILVQSLRVVQEWNYKGLLDMDAGKASVRQ